MKLDFKKVIIMVIAVVVFIILAVLIIRPKPIGRTEIGLGTEIRKCFGFTRSSAFFDSASYYCYGIPYGQKIIY